MGSNSITVEEARLIDKRAKEKHSNDTGYDYSKQVQNEIQALVEATLSLESSPRKPLSPQKAGTWNGVVITQEDIDAYNAAYPQNKQVGKKRQEIADVLSAGGSVLDEKEDAETQAQELEDKNIVPYKRFPAITTITTHFVNIDTFCYVEPKEEELYTMGPVSKDEAVILIDDKIGNEGSFSYVRSLSNSNNEYYYIPRKYLTTLGELVSTPYNDRVASAKGGEPALWTTFPINEPQYISQTAEIQVAVFLEREVLPEADINIALEEAFYLGMPKILKYEGKVSTKEYIDESFVNNSYFDKPAQAVELYVDTRAKSKVKALVKVPRRNVSPLDDSLPSWKHKEEYDIEKFSERIEKLASRIESFEEGIKSYEGKVEIFEPAKEAKKIREMPSTIKTVANINQEYEGDILKDKGNIILYWDENYTLVKMRFEDNLGRVYNLANNFSVFPKNSCVRSKRSQSLISNLNYIVEEGELKKPWKEFISIFVEYAAVQFIPTPEEVPPLEEKEGPKVKTREQLLKEDNYYNNVDRKIKKAEEREKKSTDVSPPATGTANLLTVKEKLGDFLIEGSENLYEEFLNNVDFRRIALQAVACALQASPALAFGKIKNDLNVLKEEYNTTKKQYKEGKLLDFLYPDDFPTDDISAKFFETLGRTLGMMASTVISSVLGSLISSLLGLCSDNNGKIEPPFPSPINLGNSLSELEDLANQLFGEGNIPPDVISGLLNDLANLLSPTEYCNLLRGNPSQDTLNIVKGLLEASYCTLGLDTDEQIINFFVSLANGIELDICDEIDEIVGYFPEDFLCPPDSSIRERLLAGKQMSQEQIEEQMKRERDRSRKLAEQLLNDLNADGYTPNLFCSKDEQGNVIPGETSFMDEQFAYVLETTVESMFRNIYNSFSLEGAGFVQNLFVEVQEEYQPQGADEEMRVIVTRRRLVPQLTKFYSNSDINITKDKITVMVPEVSSDSLAIISNDSGSISTEDILKDTQRRNEFLNHVDVKEITSERELQKIQLSEVGVYKKEFVANPNNVVKEESKVPAENVFNSGSEPENDCQPSEELVVPETRIVQQINNAQDILNPDLEVSEINLDSPSLPFVIQQERERGILGTKVYIDNKEVGCEKTISEPVMNIVNANLGIEQETTHSSLLKAVIYQNKKLNDSEKEEVGRYIDNIKIEASNKLLEFLIDVLSKSKYLNVSSASLDDGISSRYIIEYINLGPVPTPMCDPHLLMIAQLIEKIKEDFQSEMCLDLNPPDEGNRPRLTPVEKGMMNACVRTIVRHYILESLSCGILSVTSFQNRDYVLSKLMCSYILERMRMSMLEYSSNRDTTMTNEQGCERSATFIGALPNYYEDFLQQVEEIYGSKSEDMLNSIIESEFNVIKKGFYDSLLMSTEKSKLIDIIFENILEVEKIGNSFKLVNLNSSKYLLPFVFYEGQLCLLLDEFPLDEYSVNFEANQRYMVPLVEKDAKEYEAITSAIFDYSLKLSECVDMISIHEIETISRMENVQTAFGETRDNLFSLFYAILPEKNDWRKGNKSLQAIGGTSNYTKIFDFNNNVFDTPCTDFSFNMGSPEVCWGNQFKGLGFTTALRLARDAALIEFKKYVERNDPAVKLANRLSFLSKLACVNIPTSAIAGSLNFINPLLFPNTPMANVYHSLGLGVFLPASLLNSDSDEGYRAQRELTDIGLQLPPFCGNVMEEMVDGITTTTEGEGLLLSVETNPGLNQVFDFEMAYLSPEEISELEQRRAELRVRYLEVSDEHSRLMSIKTEIRNNIDNYTSSGRWNFDNRPAPEELLDEPKFQWNLLDDEIQSLIREQREMDAELAEIARKLNSVQR